jgi:hypothetical protein
MLSSSGPTYRTARGTRGQAAKVNKSLFPKLNCLYRLRQRMQNVGFAPDDPPYLFVEKAYDARHRAARRIALSLMQRSRWTVKERFGRCGRT